MEILIDPNITVSWIPAGSDLMNSTGFSLIPTMVDGIGFNYHFQVMEQLLAGLLLLLVVWFFCWLYFKFTREVFKE